MRRLQEMDESSGEIVVDPLESGGGDLSNQPSDDPDGD